MFYDVVFVVYVEKESHVPMIYLGVFLVSGMLFFQGGRCQEKAGRTVCYLAGLMVPCLLAALRGETVGTDVLVYMKPLLALAESAPDFVQYCHNVSTGWGTEWAYSVLNYIIGHFIGELSVWHFLTQLFISGLVFLSVKRYGNDSQIWIGMIAYYFLFYNQTYNIVRQSMACACILYSIVLMKDRKYVRTFCFFILASGFHHTAYVAAVFYLLYICNQWLDKKLRKVMYVLILAVGGLISIFYKEIILFLFDKLWFLPRRYLNLFNREFEFDIPYALIVLFMLNIAILLSVYLKKKEDGWNGYQMEIQLLAVALVPLCSVITLLVRLLMYFEYTCIVIYMDVPDLQIGLKERKRRLNGRVLLLLFLLLYWWYFYVFCGSSETYPYTFFWRE